jgi:hypothetical protein
LQAHRALEVHSRFEVRFLAVPATTTSIAIEGNVSNARVNTRP